MVEHQKLFKKSLVENVEIAKKHIDPVELLKSSKEWNFIKDKFLEYEGDLDLLSDAYIKEELFCGIFESILGFAESWLDDRCVVWADEGQDDCYGCSAATYLFNKDVINLKKLSEVLTTPNEFNGYWLPLKTDNGIYIHWCGGPIYDE